MSGDRVRFLLDTAFVQAMINRRDQHHARAISWLPRVREADEIVVTEAVLVEVGNALSTLDRRGAVDWIEGCYRTENIRVVGVDRALLGRALALYGDRPDKAWGLTDCISFVVIRDLGLTEALTADRHFVQAGFRALMLEEP